jgi:hypothetical protein
VGLPICCGWHGVRRYLLPRVEILPKIVRSPVDSCFGMSPSQALKSRPWVKPAPLPIAATTALEIIGPTPGTVITRWQPSSCCASASISADTAAMRSSNRRQSWTSSAMRLTIRGDSASVFELRISGSALRNGTTPCRTVMPRSILKLSARALQLQNDRPALIEADKMETILADIDADRADGGWCEFL